jgi:hypothetical protein
MGLSGGAIAGIVVGACALVVCIGVMGTYFIDEFHFIIAFIILQL